MPSWSSESPVSRTETQTETQQRAVECLVIVGATGIGKSTLAMSLAPTCGGEIVNADALQVYRGFDIGTAKPSEEDRRRVRHHLVDILSPEERYSAGHFARLATSAIESIRARGALPILVGGNGFYFRALFDGLSPIPEIVKTVRSGLEHRLLRDGLPALYGELLAVDEKTAKRVSPSDKQRILRALEVAEGTGKSLSWWQNQKAMAFRTTVLRIGLTLPREVLYDRLASRVRRMLESGWLDEIRELLTAGVDETTPAFQALGYRELAAHLRERCSLEEALADTVRATRRYAKRQLTWFRGETEIRFFEAEDLDAVLTEVVGYLEMRGVRVRA